MTTTRDDTLFGRGISFAPHLGPDGRVAWSAGEDNVRESIRVICMTEPGERLRLAAFGAGLRSFLFEPNIPATHRLIEERITFALARWEPRIAVDEVVVEADESDGRRANVEIRYRLVATGAADRVGVSVAVGG